MQISRITVAVCTNREPGEVLPTLEAAARQAANIDAARVLILASGVADNRYEEHRHQAAELGVGLIRTGSGLSVARNAALESATGDFEVVAYLDDDAIPMDSWLGALSARWRGAPDQVACIGGAIEPLFVVDPPGWLGKALWPTLSMLDLGSELIEMDPVGGRDVWGANVSFLAGPAKRAGGFDLSRGPWMGIPSFGDESDLEIRLQQAGHTTYYAGDVRVQHVVGPDRLTLRSVGRRAFYYGLSAADDGRLGTAAGARVVVRSAVGMLLAVVGRNRELAVVRLHRLALGWGAALAPLTRWWLRRRGWATR